MTGSLGRARSARGEGAHSIPVSVSSLALGADDGNRTRVSCLGSKRSAIELHRRMWH